MIKTIVYKLLGRYCPKVLNPNSDDWLTKDNVTYKEFKKAVVTPWFFKSPLREAAKELVKIDQEYYSNFSKHLAETD